MDISEIGGRIREARLQADMSQTELAMAMGYSGANSISKLEAGKVASIDVMVLSQIAQHTGVDISYLVPCHDALLQELRAVRAEMCEHRKKLTALHARLDAIIARYGGTNGVTKPRR